MDDPVRTDLTEYFDDATVTVSDEKYAVLKTDRADPNAFATIRDENETTVIVEQDSCDESMAEEAERDWKRLTFDLVLPFDLVGFLAMVAAVLAEEDVSIFTLSAYSTDHVLVKVEDVEPAVRKLEELGCDVQR